MTAPRAPASRAPLPPRSLRDITLAAVVLVITIAILRATPDGPLPVPLTAVTLAAAATWIVAQDLATLTIPDAAVLATAAVAAAWRWSEAAAIGAGAGETLATMSFDVAICGGALLLFREGYYRWKGVDGLGLGDVKLAAAGALLVGAIGFAWALFAASLAALAAVAASRLLGRGGDRPDRVAFGAVLAPAFWLVWFVGEALPLYGGS